VRDELAGGRVAEATSDGARGAEQEYAGAAGRIDNAERRGELARGVEQRSQGAFDD
jgi:hypothetical protein